jgi:hypothetical protein
MDQDRYDDLQYPVDVALFCRVIRHQLLAAEPPPRLSAPDLPLDEPIGNPYIPLAHRK